MEQRQTKFKPFHGVLIVAMVALTIGIYAYKDKIMPDLNVPYREEMSAHVKTQAEVITREADRGRRGSNIVVTVQFRDTDSVLHTARITDNRLQSVSQGETITIYYNPENPKEARSEASYREIMKLD